MAWLLYGQRADGELFHISEATRGDACGLLCPHCQTPLVARKGRVKVHHFAHLGPTCAHLSVYDFLHVDRYVDTSLSLSQWVKWKQQDMVETGIRLQTEEIQFQHDMAELMRIINRARARLTDVSQPHPNRRQRSKIRQNNYEVLQQWDTFLTDHNAPEPDLERVRDLESCRYYALYYIQEGRWGGRYKTGYDVWPKEMWFEENKDENWIPVWLVDGGLALLNDYPPLRRKLVTARQHLDAFREEKVYFEQFRLYFLLIEFEHQPPLFKIGITSRVTLTERIAEIRTDLRLYSVAQVSVLIELPHHAYLESYFKQKYASQQTQLGKLTEYFAFDDAEIAVILDELHCLKQSNSLLIEETVNPITHRERIRAGMAQARAQGVHVGRFRGSEQAEQFMQKPKSRQVADLITAHSNWSLREISRQSGVAINTVCKVAKLLSEHSATS